MPTAERIQLANDYRQQVERLVSGEYVDDSRKLLLIAYTDSILEHHQSIMILLDRQRFGSVFSLVRVLFEAFFCAHWVSRCASDWDVERLSRKEFDFPSMNSMVTDINWEFDTAEFFTDIRRPAWDVMNSYTHSGLQQLSRRFNDGKIMPNYSEDRSKGPHRRDHIDGTTSTGPLRPYCWLYMLGLGPVNAFLLVASDGCTVIDTGLPRSAAKLMDTLRAIQLLTHAHPHHIGGFAALKGITGAEAYMYPADAPIEIAGKASGPMKAAPGLLRGLMFRLFVPAPGIGRRRAC